MSDDLPYFAYGSNLNPDDLRAWCQRNGRPEPALTWIGPAYLPERERVFDWFSPGRGGGVLNLAHRPGQVVPGGLYAPTAEDWVTLDLKEGVGAGHYRRVVLPVLTEDGREIPAVTYVVEHSAGNHIPPTEHYLQVVKEGLARIGFSPERLDPAAQGHTPPWEIPRLFIYGTLRRHGSNRHWLREIAIHSELPATAAGALHNLGPYPGMRPDPVGRVQGELLLLSRPDQALATLDRLEDFTGFGNASHLFRRAVILARAGTGETHPAWVYLYDALPPPGSRIVSGAWPPS